MFRAMISVLASLGLLIVLSAATNKVTLQRHARHAMEVAAKEASAWPRCHTASCRDAFSPDSLKAGYMDPAMALRFQFANSVFNNQ